MQLIHIDDVGIELAQRIVEAGDDRLGGGVPAADRERGLGGNHDILTRHPLDRLAEHILGAVGRRGIEEIDPQLDRLADHRYRMPLALALGEPRQTAALSHLLRGGLPKTRRSTLSVERWSACEQALLTTHSASPLFAKLTTC